MNYKFLALLTVFLLAPLTGFTASVSTCNIVFDGEDPYYYCALYESDARLLGSSSFELELGKSEVVTGPPPTFFIFEEGDDFSGAVRNVLEFFETGGTYFLRFYFGGSLPDVVDLPDESCSDCNKQVRDVPYTDVTLDPNFYRIFHDYEPTPVPEPGSLALLGLGLVGLGLVRRRKTI